jgi:hypothetical protein
VLVQVSSSSSTVTFLNTDPTAFRSISQHVLILKGKFSFEQFREKFCVSCVCIGFRIDFFKLLAERTKGNNNFSRKI